jgi:hypothetical protein
MLLPIYQKSVWAFPIILDRHRGSESGKSKMTIFSSRLLYILSEVVTMDQKEVM